MEQYKAVRSSLDISKRIAFYLEMSDIRNPRFGDRASVVRITNDILQGRSTTSVEDLLSDLEQQAGSYYADEIAVVRQDVQDFLRQKELLSTAYGRSGSASYSFKHYRGCDGRTRKVIDQKLFDRAASDGFPPGFFRESYFDQVTIYCLPDHTDSFRSVFQNCAFAVCRIVGAAFDGASIYSSEIHSSLLQYVTFFQATFSHTHFHDSSLSHVSFQKARLKSCNMIDCALDSINYLDTTLDGCSFGRVTPADIRNLESATITQGGATAEECRENRAAIFRALGMGQEAA